jgi:hypothetical protein
MAQFDLITLTFDFSNNPSKSELGVSIDNPQQLSLSGNPTLGSVPSDVEIVQPGQEPTQALWVYAGHHHLTIILETGSGTDPLKTLNTGLYNTGEDDAYVDVIIAEKEGDDTKTKKIRRKAVIVSL